MTYTKRLLLILDAAVQGAANKGIIGICISTRAYTARVHGHGWGIWLDRWLGKIQQDHCWLSLRGDIDRATAVIAELAPYLSSEQQIQLMRALDAAVQPPKNQRTA